MKYTYLIISVLFISISSAQDFAEYGKRPSFYQFSKSITEKSFDVLHYKLDVRLGIVDDSFSGTMNIKILINQPSDSVTLHALGLVITSLKVNDTISLYRIYQSNEQFTVILPRTFVSQETLHLQINYYRDLSSLNLPYNRLGYYWFRKNPEAKIEENIAYTMSEPYDARLWMPCYDDPSDKATCEINITVPQDYQAASNGLLTGIIQNEDGTATYKWRETKPITTYLMVINVSKYSVYKQYYRKVTNPSDSIEILNYIWQVDSAGTTWNAVLAFSKVPQMIRTFSEVFGEYPFDKYGHVAAYPFYYGGMEHQTLSTVHRSWLSVNSYPFYEDYIAHELAHQWWGNFVTCRTFKDIWLNEGFATYSELLWREFTSGIQYRNELLNRYTRFSDFSWQYAIYDPASQGINIFTSNVYQKAGWVLHMLRNLVGDSTFFQILTTYGNTFSYSTATTKDFINVVNTITNSDYNWFFNQWIYGKGWLKISYESFWDNNNKTFLLTLSQIQDVSWPTYRIPIDVKFFFGLNDTTITIWDSLRVQHFNFIFESQPDSFIINPEKKVLIQIFTPPVSVGLDNYFDFYLYQNYPNPFNTSTEIKFQILNDSHVKLVIYNLMGSEVRTLLNEFKQAGEYKVNFDASELASGVYFYRLYTFTKNRTINKNNIKRDPVQIRKMLLLK